MSKGRKFGVRIWAHVLALVLMVSMFMGVGTIEAEAKTLENVEISDIQYYPSGCLKSFKFSYKVGGFNSVAADAKVSVQGIPFAESGGSRGYGDLTDLGDYAKVYGYSSWNQAMQTGKEDYNKWEFVAWNTDGFFRRPATGGTGTQEIEFADGVIDLSVEKDYYLYIWAQYSGLVYPDGRVTQFTSSKGDFENPHVHDIVYIAGSNSNEIKAYCQEDEYKDKGCSCQGETNAVTLSINAEPQGYKPNMSKNDYTNVVLEKDAWEAAGLEIPEIKYYSDAECTTEVTSTFPAAKNYYAVVTAGNVMAKDEFELKPMYDVTVTNGSLSDGSGQGSYVANDEVTITAGEPDTGKEFSKWTGAEGLEFTSGDENTATATFKMPSNAVNLTATYKHAHAWNQNWTTNDTHHWHECTASDCDITENSLKDSYGAHTWDNDSDTDCNGGCGYTRTIPGNNNTGNTNPPANNNAPANSGSTTSTSSPTPAAPVVKPAETPVVVPAPVVEEVKVLDELPPMGETVNAAAVVLILCAVLSGTALLWSFSISKRKKA